MRYGSVCSGIEAASVAWQPLGWKAAFLSEIEPFPRSVLAHHHSTAPLHGNFTTINAGDYDAIDLLVGGTPCQSFSVAGLRGGLADERGNLALEYLRLANRLKPRWILWENVPGVLSSNGGRDFGAFLGGLVQCGYGFAYRVLDAQYFGLAQRRKRVFVVGYLGDWRRAAAVLFEPQSLRGHPAPRRQAGQSAAQCPGVNVAFGISSDCFDRSGEGAGGTAGERSGLGVEEELAYALRAKRPGGVAYTLRGNGFDAREDGTGPGVPLVLCQPYTLAIRGRDGGCDLEYRQDGTSNTLYTPNDGRAGMGVGAIAFDRAQITSLANKSRAEPGLPCGTLSADSQMHVANSAGVRRLTPRECERLQGFPDNYTAVLHRGKPAADGPRYRALGNSMAVPCMAWIGQRIAAVEATL